jgi:hypothetical protein
MRTGAVARFIARDRTPGPGSPPPRGRTFDARTRGAVAAMTCERPKPGRLLRSRRDGERSAGMASGEERPRQSWTVARGSMNRLRGYRTRMQQALEGRSSRILAWSCDRLRASIQAAEAGGMLPRSGFFRRRDPLPGQRGRAVRCTSEQISTGRCRYLPVETCTYGWMLGFDVQIRVRRMASRRKITGAVVATAAILALGWYVSHQVQRTKMKTTATRIRMLHVSLKCSVGPSPAAPKR